MRNLSRLLHTYLYMWRWFRGQGWCVKALLLLVFAAGIYVYVAFILPVVLLFGKMALGPLDEWRYRPTEHFIAGRWQKPDLKYRYAVLEYASESVVHEGMTLSEVEALLGPPDSRTRDGSVQVWQYNTQRPGFYFIDFSGGGLEVRFDVDDVLRGIAVNTWVD